MGANMSDTMRKYAPDHLETGKQRGDARPMEDVIPHILVTGATRGIGRAITDDLLAAGHRVVGIARRDDPAYPAPLFHADLSDEGNTARVIRRILTEFPIGGLVNNAGSSTREACTDFSADLFRRTFDLNVRAAAQCVSLCLPTMIARGHGRIVSISSKAITGRQGFATYAGAKAALAAMTKCWALELADHGITANTVAPGAIETEMLSANNPPGSAPRRTLEAAVPMGRTGTPAEVAAAVGYFLSPGAAYTTGQTLLVCGGWSFASP
ncbi:SDR family oxidoreductase [Actibacterium sp. D379-3]